jgi:predicted RNA-binding Zn-ribbon protein involved in translation (DUF1610 family)
MQNNEQCNWMCDLDGEHWQGEARCPKCGEIHEIRRTMSREEAEARELV